MSSQLSSCNTLNDRADYYPGGMSMPDRGTGLGDYRYAYNGMETDNEVSGTGNSYTTEFRQYDPRLMRWKSLDPLMHEFPWMSPFCAFNNNPIIYTDESGESGILRIKYHKFGKNKGQIKKVTFKANLITYGDHSSNEAAKEIASDIEQVLSQGNTVYGFHKVQVNYRIKGQHRSFNRAYRIAKRNRSFKRNFARVDSPDDFTVEFDSPDEVTSFSRSNNEGGNSYYLLSTQVVGSTKNSTTATHEFTHGAGLDHNSAGSTDDEGNRYPNIMTTQYDAQYDLFDPSVTPETIRELRKFNQENFQSFHIVPEENTNSRILNIGRINNVIFDKNGAGYNETKNRVNENWQPNLSTGSEYEDGSN